MRYFYTFILFLIMGIFLQGFSQKKYYSLEFKARELTNPNASFISIIKRHIIEMKAKGIRNPQNRVILMEIGRPFWYKGKDTIIDFTKKPPPVYSASLYTEFISDLIVFQAFPKAYNYFYTSVFYWKYQKWNIMVVSDGNVLKFPNVSEVKKITLKSKTPINYVLKQLEGVGTDFTVDESSCISQEINLTLRIDELEDKPISFYYKEKEKKKKRIIYPLKIKFGCPRAFFKTNFLIFFPERYFCNNENNIMDEVGEIIVQSTHLDTALYNTLKNKAKAIYSPKDTNLLVRFFFSHKDYFLNNYFLIEDGLPTLGAPALPYFGKGNNYPIQNTNSNLFEDFEILEIDSKKGRFLERKYLKENALKGVILPKIWKHGYSRCVAVSKKRNVMIYWLIIW